MSTADRLNAASLQHVIDRANAIERDARLTSMLASNILLNPLQVIDNDIRKRELDGLLQRLTSELRELLGDAGK